MKIGMGKLSRALGALLLGVIPAFAQEMTGYTINQSPVLVAGTGWTGPTPQPSPQGSSGDTGYGEAAIAEWDPDVGQWATIKAAQPICVLAYAGGGVKSVQIALDGGAWVDAPLVQRGPYTYGATKTYPAYCVQLNPATIPDGAHELRAIVTPVAGLPAVLQSSMTASLTNGQPIQITGYPHPWIAGRILLAAQSVGGLTAGSSYVVGAYTADTFFLSDSSLLTKSSYGYYSPPAVTAVATGTPTTITQAPLKGQSTWAAGQLMSFVPAGSSSSNVAGLSLSKAYYVCNGTTTTYQLASTLANALASNCDVPTTGAKGSGFTAWPVMTATATGSIDLYVADSKSNELTVEGSAIFGESLRIATNASDSIAQQVAYVDSSSALATACGTSVAPCDNIHDAITALAWGSASRYFIATESNGAGGCAKFTVSATATQPVAGQPVDFAITSLGTGSPFTIQAGISTLANQSYYVVNNADLGLHTFDVSATPGGSCLLFGTTADTGITAYPDLAGSTIYLMCDGSCTSPSQYLYGALSESYATSTNYSYLDIMPAPGFAHDSVQLIGEPTNTGIRTNKVHIGVDIVPTVVSATTNLDSPIGSNSFQFPGTPNIAVGDVISDLADCASGALYGGTAGWTTTTVQSVTSSGGNTTVTMNATATNFADCPLGTKLTFENNWTPTGNYALWLDHMVYTGPGAWASEAMFPPIGTGVNAGRYATHIIVTQNSIGMYHFTYTKDSHAYYTGSVGFNAPQEVVASSGHVIDFSLKTFNVTWSAGTPNVLTFAGCPGASCTYPTDGLIRTGLSVSGTGIPTSDYVVGHNSAAGTITLNAAATASPGTIDTTSWQHNDIFFLIGTFNDTIIEDTINDPTDSGIGWGPQSGPTFRAALSDSVLNLATGPYMLSFQTFLQSAVLQKNFFSPAAGAPFISIYSPGTLAIFDGVHFLNNTCAAAVAGQISSAISGVSGVSLSGGNC